MEEPPSIGRKQLSAEKTREYLPEFRRDEKLRHTRPFSVLTRISHTKTPQEEEI